MPPRLRWHLYRLLSVGVDKIAVLFQFILFGNRFAVAVFDEHHHTIAMIMQIALYRNNISFLLLSMIRPAMNGVIACADIVAV